MKTDTNVLYKNVSYLKFPPPCSTGLWIQVARKVTRHLPVVETRPPYACVPVRKLFSLLGKHMPVPKVAATRVDW